MKKVRGPGRAASYLKVSAFRVLVIWWKGKASVCGISRKQHPLQRMKGYFVRSSLT